ncbi:putative villin headpiece, villin/Gelsolin, ADF-H/Gelsolin-like domain superfamily [Helianthus annuus]|uniref:Putative villin headpiece, Villin/Gelsolin, ADF-H/Gelsolin-like domain protein n=1 Tax=Helianthus annuus TaxID=4232 RepID=A0A251UL01_HELAN|nr:villin-3 [Helianthus annuus]KAF5804279.1 putative villin headpiece, villin/Gelsolin, ADF-H/Gelsolin-like domain superfamily [Helianthus annuus]KAJ0568944.1 putative villin headpiece, villin/Gelsolin, ADF-H/Gelsolin-like domain superfamily [Helianthus annuus]KAJ0583222.1 putative villin headpiece, villin/Gelsolin, ADF-H/Gelsolin-like domain superfamily [Helianthus annuus]KAJ0745958.1 putative villin headpiece, villin/Gelsolin, ADF-H/Gelsolin-like domain superfamily [Helianthus annuus]KAJ0917
MSGSAKTLEPAFQGAGQRVGTEIWRIENFQPVPLPKSNYGKFYSGDSYIVLQTTSGKGGAYFYDIHFWLGKDTSQDEAGTAAIKTVELDAVLGGRAVQYREPQGHESDKFLSYFKPCIIPLEGGVASGFKETEEEEFQTRLYTCKGKRVVKLKQVPFSRSTLNHDDVFILDTKDKIFQFNGANSNIQERAKALEVIQFLKDKYHEGTCDVAIVDDGKLQAEGDSGEFWVIFGGFAPIGKKVASEDDIIPEKTPPKLYCITEGQVKEVDGELSKSLLENNKCYLLDCGSEVFVWVGRVTQVEERKAAMQAAEEFITSQNRPKSTRVTRLIQGYETHSFKSNFDSWPSGSAPSAPEEGRGKVAALLKQQGVGLKGLAKASTAVEEVPPLLEENGKIEVWRINGSAKTPVAKEDVGKFYSGDCYIVLYTYHSNEKKEDYYLCCWIGKDSIEEDQNMAARLATTMFNSLKGRPVQGRVYQGKEPPQFVAIFQPMVVLKGGLSSGYKNYIADKGLNDETYSSDEVALIQISGTSLHNNKAVQVEAVATSLNSYDCFLLQSGSSLFTWHGNQSTVEQHTLAAKIAEFLKPGANVKFAKEGTENQTFWFALGGKQGYTSKKVTQETVREPHLFAFSFNKGKFEIEEIYNFSQDDLLTEDILILDTHAEVFVWVGQSVDSKEKQSAFEVGQKYIESAASLDGLSPSVPLYRVTEGNEPNFFTTFFSWDSAKANAHGNSFQKKILLMFGLGGGHSAESQDRSNGNQGGPTQRASALAALNSAFKSSPPAKSSASPKAPSRGSQRAAAVAALSSVLTAEKKGPSDASPVRPVRSPPSETVSPAIAKSEEPSNGLESNEGSEVTTETSDPVQETNGEGSATKSTTEEPECVSVDSRSTFSYEQLRAKSENPVTGIDFKRREAYLSAEEFEAVLGMTKEAFYKIPKWKQDMMKKKVDLF